jgi:hypothetical protein
LLIAAAVQHPGLAARILYRFATQWGYSQWKSEVYGQ